MQPCGGATPGITCCAAQCPDSASPKEGFSRSVYETAGCPARGLRWRRAFESDRKSTRLNSSHLGISYAVFCLKKKSTQVPHTCRSSLGTGARLTAFTGRPRRTGRRIHVRCAGLAERNTTSRVFFFFFLEDGPPHPLPPLPPPPPSAT